VLFSVSGRAFTFRVAPLQVKIAKLARAAGDTDKLDWPRYHALVRSWEIWGAVATLTPLAAVVLMVIKPALPAL
jgi:uncharacterized membrane protein